MLSYLDPILFPDECEILVGKNGQLIYPIFKNGSSSLRADHPELVPRDQLQTRVAQVQVYVREPFERYVSGVQTYLKNNPHLDRATALTMIDQYLFLDRHFALQFHWLVNLVRQTNNPWITIVPWTELSNATELTWNVLARDETLTDYFKSNNKLWYYLQLDKVLTEDFVGQTAKFTEILAHIKVKYSDLYQEVIQRNKGLCTVLD